MNGPKSILKHHIVGLSIIFVPVSIIFVLVGYFGLCTSVIVICMKERPKNVPALLYCMKEGLKNEKLITLFSMG